MGTMPDVNPMTNGTRDTANGGKPRAQGEALRTLATYPSQSLRFLGHVSNEIRLQTNTRAGLISPKPTHIKLNVVIVGAGLGGLALSIALARRGHVVRILEQAKQLGEVSKTLHDALSC